MINFFKRWFRCYSSFMKVHSKKWIIAVCAVYIVSGLATIIYIGGFSHQVNRRVTPDFCKDIQPGSSLSWQCAETQEVRYANYYGFGGWAFSSDNLGHDVAKYFPVDLIIAFVIGSVLSYKVIKERPPKQKLTNKK